MKRKRGAKDRRVRGAPPGRSRPIKPRDGRLRWHCELCGYPKAGDRKMRSRATWYHVTVCGSCVVYGRIPKCDCGGFLRPGPKGKRRKSPFKTCDRCRRLRKEKRARRKLIDRITESILEATMSKPETGKERRQLEDTRGVIRAILKRELKKEKTT